MRGVEIRFEEEGVVSLGGMDGDVHGIDVCFLKVFYEFRLFLRVEAEIGIDGEDEPFLSGFCAAVEEFVG